jgi:hypothetical protein
MTSRLAAAVLFLGTAFVALPSVAAQPAPVDTSALPVGKDAWDLRPLSGDPVKLVKVAYDEKAKEARFVLEFTRDLTVRDIDWSGVRAQPPFRFQFEDADGVTLSSPLPTYEGVLVGLKGRRLRIVLKMPEPYVMDRTRKVVVDFKPYGS